MNSQHLPPLSDYQKQVRQVQRDATPPTPASISAPDPMWGNLADEAGEELDQASRSSHPATRSEYQKTQPLPRTRPAATPPPSFGTQAPEPEVVQPKESFKEKCQKLRDKMDGFQKKLKLGKHGGSIKGLLLEDVFTTGTCWTGTILPLLIVLPPTSRSHLLIVLACVAISSGLIGSRFKNPWLARHGLIGCAALVSIHLFYQTFLAACYRSF